jgi:hypothetical protein
VDFASTKPSPPSKPSPSIRLAEAPRLDSMPGARYPTHTAAVGAVSRVGSPPGATRTTVKGRPSHLLIAILPWIVAAVVSEQIDYFRLLDRVGRNHVAFSAPWSEFEPLYRR